MSADEMLLGPPTPLDAHTSTPTTITCADCGGRTGGLVLLNGNYRHRDPAICEDRREALRLHRAYIAALKASSTYIG